MSYNYSYNVIIDRLKTFADGHYLIRRFTHGSINLSDLPQDGQYPFMHVAPDAFIPVEGGMRFALMVSFFDIPRDKEQKAEYQKEALSDCTRLAQDLISEIQVNRVLFGPEVSLASLPEIEPWLEEKKNTVTGVSMLLDIEVPHFWSGCDIPAEYAVGGSSTGGYGQGGTTLLLKTNSVDNTVQTVLDLVEGANVTITDLGDGRVQISASGSVGANWGTIGGTLANQTDLQTVLDTKVNEGDLALVALSGDYNDLDNLPSIPAAQVNSDWDATTGVEQILNKPTLATVATSGDYNDLTNLPTIPDPSTFVPYTGAGSNVNLGENKLTTQDALGFTEMAPSYVTARNSDSSKYAQIENDGLTVVDDAAGDTMSVNAGGLTFPDTTSQYTAAVNADWNSTSGLSEILNKPTIPAVIGDMTKAVYDTDDDGIVDSAERVEIIVRNSTGATLTKGQVVYLSGATGNRPNAVLADASTEATSSKTIGFVVANIPNNSDGAVAVNGTLHDLDTSAFTAGSTLWLAETPGAWTANTPPAEPAHAVFLGYVARSHPNLGRIVIQVQNGYELKELHGVEITTEADRDALMFSNTTGLWENRPIESKDISDSTQTGRDLLTLPNPGAIRYLRINADSSIAALTANQLKADLGLISQIQATQLTNSSTTVGVDISGCAVSLDAGATYTGRMSIASGSIPVLGYNLTFTFPSGSTMLIGRIVSGGNATTQTMSWQTVTSGTALNVNMGTAQNQSGYAELEIYIVTGGTAGTLTPTFKSNSTGSAITIYAGLTHINLQKI